MDRRRLACLRGYAFCHSGRLPADADLGVAIGAATPAGCVCARANSAVLFMPNYAIRRHYCQELLELAVSVGFPTRAFSHPDHTELFPPPIAGPLPAIVHPTSQSLSLVACENFLTSSVPPLRGRQVAVCGAILNPQHRLPVASRFHFSIFQLQCLLREIGDIPCWNCTCHGCGAFMGLLSPLAGHGGFLSLCSSSSKVTGWGLVVNMNVFTGDASLINATDCIGVGVRLVEVGEWLTIVEWIWVLVECKLAARALGCWWACGDRLAWGQRVIIVIVVVLHLTNHALIFSPLDAKDNLLEIIKKLFKNFRNFIS